MNIKITIDKIDYSAIAKKALPLISEKAEEMNDGLAKSVLMGAINTGAVEKALEFLPQKLKNEVAVKLIENNKPELLKYVADLLEKKNIPVSVNDLQISEQNGMIETNIKISEINYDNIAEQLFPIALEKLRSYEGDNILIRTVGKMQSVPDGLVTSILSTLPQEAKDELVVYFINGYNNEIISAVNSYAESKQIKISVADVKIVSE